MKCRCCGNPAELFDTAIVLGKYQVRYYRCPFCGFIETEDPFWLNEAYSEAIADIDIGLVGRNVFLSKVFSSVFKYCLSDAKSFLDYGGGTGMLVRLLRDSGFEAYWYDKYATNMFAKHFERDPEKYYDVVIATELFEHFPNPVNDVVDLIKVGKDIIFTTELLPDNLPKVNEWWYYAPQTGQHIAFYTEKALAVIGQKFNMNYAHCGSIHLFSQKKVDIDRFVASIRYYEEVNRKIVKQSLLAKDFEFVSGRELK